ncbi:MAG: hypothetical protein J5917_06750 [Bacteroidales bacterium]|nr:hypothetical protein [Bacteroidales bacterium]
MMNKLIKTLAVTAAAIAALSCTKEADNNVQEKEKTVSFTASIADAMGTKLAADADGKVTWEADDAIRVYMANGEERKFTLSAGAGTGTATFTGSIPDGTTASFAIYPYYGLSPALSGTDLSLTLPAVYDLQGGKNPAIPMFGKLSGENSFAFTHLCGVIRFHFKNVPATGGRFRFTSNNLKVTGTHSISTTATTPELVAATGSANYVDIVYDAPNEHGKDVTLDVIVPTGTYNNFAVRFYTTDGSTPLTQTATVTQDANVVTRKKMLAMPTLDLAVFREEFETGSTWNVANTTIVDNPASTSVNASEKVIDATGYFSFTVPQPTSPFQYLRSSAKVIRCKYYIGSNAGAGFPALRNGASPNPYVIPTRVNGTAVTDENRTTIFSASEWNILEWDVNGGASGTPYIRPYCDKDGDNITVPAGAKIYFDDIEVLL